MAAQTPKTKTPKNNTQKQMWDESRYPARPQAGAPEVVDPKWLLGAIGLTLLGALVCGYLTLCFLVYQGQWQLLLHPVAGVTKPPASLPVTAVRFGATESGQARLQGWWIPTSAGQRHRYTLLLLHDGSGSLAANERTLEALHATGVNVFAFDYRGFGESEGTHPNEQRMSEDAESALNYLITTRHLASGTIVPYGAGIGAALAVHLAAEHKDLPGLMLESPQPDILGILKRDPRAGMVPLSMLFHEKFEIAPELSKLATPKLLLSAGPSPVEPVPAPGAVDALFRAAASPNLAVHLERPVSDTAFAEALNRYLDEYLR